MSEHKMILMHGRYVPVLGGQTPLRATLGSTGFDCFARITDALAGWVRILPGERKVIPLGFRLEILARHIVTMNTPEYIEAFENVDLDHTSVYQFELRSRSGLAARSGIAVLNAPGTIDADYEDEVCAILINHGDDDFIVENGTRVCQAVWPHYMPWAALPDGLRCLGADREGGFGSTGAR
jgi:dUTPase